MVIGWGYALMRDTIGIIGRQGIDSQRKKLSQDFSLNNSVNVDSILGGNKDSRKDMMAHGIYFLLKKEWYNFGY